MSCKIILVYLNILSCFIPFSWFHFPAITTFHISYRVSWWNFSFFILLGTKRKPVIQKGNLSKCLPRKLKSEGVVATQRLPTTYFFCVSPAFTRIRRTCSTGLGGFVFQAQNVFLRFFQTEFQESDSLSQLRVIFNRSPISSSVNTKKVLVKFRPMVPS